MIERFRTLPAAWQFGIAGSTMLIMLSAVFAGWFALRTPYRPLFTQLRPRDAAAIVEELDHRRTPYRLDEAGATILVPAAKVGSTRLALMNGNLALKGTVGFELFNKSDMGVTDFAQRINYQRALQGELGRTIMSLDGVDESRVHLSLGEDRIFREDRVAPKASVTIRMRPGATLAQEAVAGVQRLVAAAVPQLDADNVVILDEAGAAISPTGSTSLPLSAINRAAVQAPPDAAPRSRPDAAMAGEDADRRTLLASSIAAATLLSGSLLLWLIRRRRRKDTLSATERDRLAARLADLLEREERDGAAIS